ncbi:MAG: ribonuclease [Oscillospiraceae bacterium]|nr:ribonuclease [Oscillospiraceae bacterium]
MEKAAGQAAEKASEILQEANTAAETITGGEDKNTAAAGTESTDKPEEPGAQAEEEPEKQEEEEPYRPDEDGYYYDLENVELYIDCYGCLPDNFITKKEAEALGWSGGSVQKYREGAAIGGDYFGNREGLLPKASGRKYTECDLNTDGKSSRGAERLVFSNDWLYFYTGDHYESFRQVIITDSGEVAFK